MDKRSTVERLDFLVKRLESLYESLGRQQDVTNTIYETLKSESQQALQEARLLLNVTLQLDSSDIPAYTIPLSDTKLQKVWKELFNYPDGATADHVAIELKRHRSTVSTYLNMLVAMGFAEKSRRGHEIYYKALIKSEK